MSLRSFLVLMLEALSITVCILSLLAVAQAEVRSSTNYQLESDSINFSGGLSTSTNYQLESTAGEVATGEATSTSYRLKAGYQQMQEVYLSLTTPDNVNLTPSLGGITGGIASGSTSVLVLTDSPSGYSLTLEAQASPAMQKGSDTIADYVPTASPLADLAFITTMTDVHFGFSPSGPDVVLRYRNDTSACGVGVLSTPESCWDGLSTTPILIAEGVANHPDGVSTTLDFRVGIGGGVVVPEGEYIATTTLTALPL
jgi:hypothetical protein